MAAKKTLWIVLGCGGFVLVVCAALAGFLAVAVMRNLEVRATPAAAAEHEYDDLRSRFQGQPALIEMDPDEPGSVKVNQHPEKAPAGRVERIHAFAWNPREGKVLRLTLPFWIVRLKTDSGSVNWQWSNNVRVENLKVTVEDIERWGPGLLLDFEDRNGDRLLVWSE